MPAWMRWTLGGTLAVLLTVVPFVYYRYEYTYGKRLREVTPGRFYRSGQMTAPGFIDTVNRYHIKVIVNLQDEYPDPEIALGYFTSKTIPESELCRQLGVRYVYLPPDLIPRRLIPAHRPTAIDRFLALLDDEANYPILIHCRAGMHRTGVMTAVYRMEYEGYGPLDALREMRANGFLEYESTSANDYITQYILTYRRGLRRSLEGDTTPGVPGSGSVMESP
jgi:protein tyrosine/serine phosphatase